MTMISLLTIGLVKRVAILSVCELQGLNVVFILAYKALPTSQKLSEYIQSQEKRIYWHEFWNKRRCIG